MKTFCLILLFSLFYFPSNGQDVFIPDIEFKIKLISLGIDVNGDKEISFAEAKNVDSLYLRPVIINPQSFKYEDTINTLVGIESFVNLKYLNIGNNPIRKLDLSSNNELNELQGYQMALVEIRGLKNDNLAVLNLNQNHDLENIDLTGLSNLKYLDLSYTKVDKLDFRANNKLKKLYLQKFTSETVNLAPLVSLEYFSCTFSKIKHLDISKNTKLKELDTDRSPMQNIIIENNDSLEIISANYGELQSLDVTGAPNLRELNCVINKLRFLKVAGLHSLKYLNCGVNSLKSLDISNNTSLRGLTCYENRLEDIILKNNTSLKNISIYKNKLTNLNFDEIPNIRSIDCAENLFAILTINHPKIKSISLSGNQLLTFLDIIDAKSFINISLNYMPQNIKVCVWELPFPPKDRITVGQTGSPNISFNLCPQGLIETRNGHLEIFPNPISEEFTVKFSNVSRGSFLLSIKNIDGKTVYRRKVFQQNDYNIINVHSLSPGIYIVIVTKEEQIYRQNIIVR